MAEESIERASLTCPVCLDLLSSPVTIPCGHSFCMICIQNSWRQTQDTYPCPQCRKRFMSRPELNKNIMLAKLVEQIIKSTPSSDLYAGPLDVPCDVCTGQKLKAERSCLQCVVSFCKSHLQPHHDVPMLQKHQLVAPCHALQENICHEHKEVKKRFCRTDQQPICAACCLDKHSGHAIVSSVDERLQRQAALEVDVDLLKNNVVLKEADQRWLEHKNKYSNQSAESATLQCTKTFAEITGVLKNIQTEVHQHIISQQRSEVHQNNSLRNTLHQEVINLTKTISDLEELSNTQEDNHFLLLYPTAPSPQSAPAPSRSNAPAPSLSSAPAPSTPNAPALSRPSAPAPSRPSAPAPSRPSALAPSRPTAPAPSHPTAPAPSGLNAPAPSTISTPAPSLPSASADTQASGSQSAAQQPTDTHEDMDPSSVLERPPMDFDYVIRFLEAFREKFPLTLKDFKLPEPETLLPAPEPVTREDLLCYSREIALDQNSADYMIMAVSNSDKRVNFISRSLNPDEFSQVLSKYGMTGRSYWEVDVSQVKCVTIAVSYKDSEGQRCANDWKFGQNDKSWALKCANSKYSFCFNSVTSDIIGPVRLVIGVYLDHKAGILSFYSVSGEMATLLHKVQTRFIQPLYAGIGLNNHRDVVSIRKLRSGKK